MARKPTGRPPGPGAILIDWDKVDRLLEAGCNGEEIAGYLGCHADTFYKRVEQEKGVGFTAYSRQKRSRGDSILRAKQTEVALKGNTTMLIWLGKQRLGQKEKDDDIQVTPETMAAFQSFMDMLNKAQSSALNKEETSNNTESKS